MMIAGESYHLHFCVQPCILDLSSYLKVISASAKEHFCVALDKLHCIEIEFIDIYAHKNFKKVLAVKGYATESFK